MHSPAHADTVEIDPAGQSSEPGNLQWTGLTIRQVSGERPFVPVRINGHDFSLMVHSLASFYIQTTHANAALAGITPVGKKRDFGIVAEGKVSDLGYQRGKVKELVVAGDVVQDKTIEIFEIPQQNEDRRPVDGMIGTLWLRERGVIIDYGKTQIAVPATQASAEAFDAVLLRSGYTQHLLQWDDQNQTYYVTARINGIPARILVSTVADDVIDYTVRDKFHLSLQPNGRVEGGPSGAVVPVYDVVGETAVVVDGKPIVTPLLQSWDRSAYSSVDASEARYDAVIGSGVMLKNAAVIDFHTGKLFFK